MRSFWIVISFWIVECGIVVGAGVERLSSMALACPSLERQTIDQGGTLLVALTGNILPRFQLTVRITRNKTSVSEEYYTVNAPSASEAKKLVREKIRNKYPNVTGIKFVKSKKLD